MQHIILNVCVVAYGYICSNEYEQAPVDVRNKLYVGKIIYVIIFLFYVVLLDYKSRLNQVVKSPFRSLVNLDCINNPIERRGGKPHNMEKSMSFLDCKREWIDRVYIYLVQLLSAWMDNR